MKDEYTAFLMPLLQLLPGADVIAVYADASYSQDLQLGCWAYTIPSFAILECGVEPGCSNNRLEFAAVVQGLAAATTLDRTTRRIDIHTDSDYVISLMDHVVRRTNMPDRKSYRTVSDLYSQASDLTVGRVVKTSRRGAAHPHHDACHKKAGQELRRYCSDGKLARAILLKNAYAKRASRIHHMRNAEQLLKTLGNKLLKCDTEIAALQYVAQVRPSEL